MNNLRSEIEKKKLCYKCQQLKERTEFYKSSRNKDGLGSPCKVCRYKLHKDWKLKNIDKMKTYRLKWSKNNQESERESRREWRRKNPRKYSVIYSRYLVKVKRQVFEAYGGASCRCCGETELNFLSIDHMDNNGTQFKKQYKVSGGSFYSWVKSRNFPQDLRLQVLCYNCNLAKGFFKICPHEQQRNKLVQLTI